MGLKIILEKHLGDIRIISASKVGDLEEHTEPDLIILGINALPNEDGEHSAVEIMNKFGNSKLIVLDESTSTDSTLFYMRKGAKGYISKRSEQSELLDCIDLVLNGQKYINPEHFGVLFDKNSKDYRASKRKRNLTSGQYRIAACLSQGMEVSAIAQKLGLKFSKVSSSKSTIYSKLGVSTPAELQKVLQSNL